MMPVSDAISRVKGSGAEAQEPTTQSPPKWHWLPSGQPDCASDQAAGYSVAKEGREVTLVCMGYGGLLTGFHRPSSHPWNCGSGTRPCL